jgi:sterol desaturase/sphingolipid hydroxylase (fatty acid hydroxylase superfamily)
MRIPLEALLKNASELYAFHYFGIIILVSLLECVAPRREPGHALRLRWVSNFGITIVDALFLRVVFPAAGLGWALYCEQRGWGVFNHMAAPLWVTLPLAVLALDLTAFGQHYLLHHVPLFWRMHRTHHSDNDCDFSTGVRFHPLESVFTTTVFTAAIALLGLPPAAVLISGLLSTVITFAEHGNIRMAPRLERALGFFVVTPGVHRIHHSSDISETNSNYGTLFTWWDRVFGTYVAEPAAGHDRMTFGLGDFRERHHQTLRGLLIQPFANLKADPEQNREGLALDFGEVLEHVVYPPKALRVSALEDNARDFDTATKHQAHVRRFEPIVECDAGDLVPDLDLDSRTSDAVHGKAILRVGPRVHP